MKDLITVIAKALVDHPEEVRVAVVEKEDKIEYRLSVHPDDVGKVIGKQGKIAKVAPHGRHVGSSERNETGSR